MGARVIQLPLLDSEPALTPPSLRSVIPSSQPQPRKGVKRGQAWIALNFPLLPLHAALKGNTQIASRSGLPIAVIGSDRMRRILCCNDQAIHAGIRPGHTFNAAIALCGDVVLLARNVATESTLLNDIAAVCVAYTPTVSLEPPNELLLEVRGSLRLFGGATKLIEHLRTTLESQGLAPVITLAPTSTSALWIARSAQGSRIVLPRELPRVLGVLPISSLQWPEDIVRRLQRFGVQTVGDLLRLPRTGLARRIGYEQLRALDRALGKERELRQTFRTNEGYEDRLGLEFEIETTALLERMLILRLERLSRFLRKRALAIPELVLELQHRDHSPTPLRIGLAAPTSDMGHVAKLLHEALAALQLPAPVRDVDIVVPRLHETQPPSGDLALSPRLSSDSRSSGESAARLLEHLHARLGANAIRSLAATADRRPERAHTETPARIGTIGAHEIPEGLPPRPMWLLREPKLVINHEREARELAICTGPERIDNGWWDCNPVDRDYFVVHSRQGALCWMFRDRTQPANWYLHGLFG
jgi:protein ImuB